MADRAVRERVRLWALAALLAVLAIVVGYQVLGGTAGNPQPAPARPNRAARTSGGPEAPPPDVRLESLGAEAASGAEPSSARNPFRFQPRAPARPAPAEGGGAAARPAPVTQRPAAPTARPIALKFIGTVESPDAGLIAALSDGTFVFHGREGDVIDGRYRIVKIGVESIVLEHVDGGGQQTIRLTG